MKSISLSFLVHKIVKRRSGIVPNLPYTMALLGGNPILFSTVGQDFGEGLRGPGLEGGQYQLGTVSTDGGGHADRTFLGGLVCRVFSFSALVKGGAREWLPAECNAR